ncbi:MAG: hypothetical protein J6S85_12850 [Methanobrevibacter sp.]|nr:hypothetical protein [Methanobrevibacter sp.]
MLGFTDYFKINTYNGLRKPSEMHANDNMLSGMISRYLLQRAMSVFEWELPESIDERYFLYTLFVNGYIAVFNEPKYGVIAQRCAFKNYNLYYQPAQITVANGKFFKRTITRTINKDCVLFTLEEDYRGIADMVSFYAGMLAECWLSLAMNLKNSHFSYMFGCESKQQAESMKKLFDKVASGDVAVFYDKNLHDKLDNKLNIEMFNNDLKGNFIVLDIIESIRSILHMFDTSIGICNSNTEKRERVTSFDVNSNNFETLSRPDMWLKRLQRNCESVNSMFGVDMSVNWRYEPTATTTLESEV